MRAKRIACLLIAVLFCFSISSCDKFENAIAEDLKSNMKPADLFSVLSDYSKQYYASEPAIMTKGVDYDTGSESEEEAMAEWQILPTPFPDRIMSLNTSIPGYNNDDRNLVLNVVIGEYDDNAKAMNAFKAIVDKYRTYIGEKILTPYFTPADLGEEAYSLTEDSGYICFGIQGNEIAQRLLDIEPDNLKKYLGYDVSDLNVIATSGYYVVDKYVIHIDLTNLVLKNSDGKKVDVDKLLGICEALGIKNPLSVNTNYEIAMAAHQLTASYLFVMTHNLQVKAVDAEINEKLQ